MPPYLPPELLHRIIHWATLMPAEAITAPERDPLASSESFLLRTKRILDSLYEILDIKLSLCHVSKMWNNLCQDFMYEFLIIRDAAWIPLFLDKIINNKVNSSHIRRLDILAMGIYTGEDRPRSADVAVAELILLCRELRVCTVDMELFYIHNVRLARALSSSPHLALIELRSVWGAPFSGQLLELVGAKGTAMIFWVCTKITPHWETAPTFLSLPISLNLENFIEPTFNDNDSSVINRRFTHVLIGADIPTQLMTGTRTIFQHINILSFSRTTFHQMFSPGYLSRLPTTVHTLIFHMDELPMTFRVGFLYIRYLGLKGKPPSPAEFDFYLHRSIGDNGDNQTVLFPMLQVIRLIDKELADCLKQRPLQHKLWDYRCQSKGIQLEDDEGKAMTFG